MQSHDYFQVICSKCISDCFKPIFCLLQNPLQKVKCCFHRWTAIPMWNIPGDSSNWCFCTVSESFANRNCVVSMLRWNCGRWQGRRGFWCVKLLLHACNWRLEGWSVFGFTSNVSSHRGDSGAIDLTHLACPWNGIIWSIIYEFNVQRWSSHFLFTWRKLNNL